MKKYIVPAIKLTLVLLVLLCVIYPLAVWGVAQLAPNAGKGQTVMLDGKTYYTNVGQKFTEDRYFWSRPSSVEYDASGSGGSNKGPSDPEYLAEVQQRIDYFLEHNPEVKKSEIPVDMVTASGSGLDPHISVQGALVQVKRIAKVRNISEEKIQQLVAQYTEKPLLGIFGPEKINVLQLNLALDQLQP